MKKNIDKLIMLALAMLLLAGCKVSGEVSEEQTTEEESFFSALEEELNYEKVERFASDEEYPQLASFLIEYYRIPEEYLEETRYYYNFIDLNEDGRDEIVALTIGETTSTSEGECILIVSGEDKTFQVLGDFRDARTPVLISDAMAEGWHEVIYPVYGGLRETGYIKCSYQKNEGYRSSEEDFFEELDSPAGVWVLSDNLIDDLDQGNYMTLKQGP